MSVFLLIVSLPSLSARNKGLNKPQDPENFPKSRVAVIQPKVLPKIAEETKIVSTSDNEWIK
jgi:hypothetical protein